MNSEIHQVIFCEDGKYRVYCDVCDNLCIQRYYRNHLKSKSHINNIRKAFEAISLN